MTGHTSRADLLGVTEFTKEEVRLSRQQAAERLVDVAYMLTTGGPLEVNVGGEIVRLVVAEQLVFERQSRSRGDCIELRWSFASEIMQSA